MAWKVELDRAAVRELGKLDQQTARRILAFLPWPRCHAGRSAQHWGNSQGF